MARVNRRDVLAVGGAELEHGSLLTRRCRVGNDTGRLKNPCGVTRVNKRPYFDPVAVQCRNLHTNFGTRIRASETHTYFENRA